MPERPRLAAVRSGLVLAWPLPARLDVR